MWNIADMMIDWEMDENGERILCDKCWDIAVDCECEKDIRDYVIEYYPNYSSCDFILLFDLVERFLDDELEDENDIELVRSLWEHTNIVHQAMQEEIYIKTFEVMDETIKSLSLNKTDG